MLLVVLFRTRPYLRQDWISHALHVSIIIAKENHQKMQEEKNGKPKADYVTLDKKRAGLSAVWALAITPLAINVVFSTFSQFQVS